MESTELKKWIWRIVRFVWNIFALFGVFVCGYFLYLVFDEEGYCLSSQQGVWDNEQKICRKDCIKWSQEQGCITEKCWKVIPSNIFLNEKKPPKKRRLFHLAGVVRNL